MLAFGMLMGQVAGHTAEPAEQAGPDMMAEHNRRLAPLAKQHWQLEMIRKDWQHIRFVQVAGKSPEQDILPFQHWLAPAPAHSHLGAGVPTESQQTADI
jgi:hypothetical protein